LNPAPAGSDGASQKGIVWPKPRFTDNGNGTVTDNLTGLIWLKDVTCTGMQDWSSALTFASTLYDGWTGYAGGGDCGLSDGSRAGAWRLPNLKELHSLVHYDFFDPAVPNTAGTGIWSEGNPFLGVVSDSYWSSSTHAASTSEAWLVYMYNGVVSTNDKTYTKLDIARCAACRSCWCPVGIPIYRMAAAPLA
jgi:hypothetical protein